MRAVARSRGAPLGLGLLGCGLLACGGLFGCGGPPAAAPAPAVVIASAAVAAPGAVPVAAAVDTTLPAGAALVGSLDLGKLAGSGAVAALRLLDGGAVEALERALDLPAGGLGTDVLAALGVDGARPVTAAVAWASPETLAVLEPLRKLVPAKDPEGKEGAGLFEAVHGAADKLGTLLQGRLLVPAVDAARVRKAVLALLRRGGLTVDGNVASLRDVRVEVGGDAATVVVDFARGRRSREAIAAVRARAPGALHEDAPALEGRTARLTYRPAAIADLAFAAALSTVDAALSSDAVEPAMREKIAAQGLWEAGQADTLAGNAKGAYFDRVDLSARYDEGHDRKGQREVELRADAGPAFAAPPEAVWKQATTIAVKGPTQGGSDVSRALLEAWPFPGEPAGHGVEPTRFAHLARAAGWAGPVVGLPSGVLALLLPQGGAPASFVSRAATGRFERLGTFTPVIGGSVLRQVTYGVLPEGAPPALAECALADAVPCKARLKLGATTELGGSFVRLVAVDRRFVVLVSHDRASLDVGLTLRPVAPAWVDIPPMGALIADRSPSPPVAGGHLVGSLERRTASPASPAAPEPPPSIVWRLAAP